MPSSMITLKQKRAEIQEKDEKEVRILMEPVIGGTYVW